MDSVTNASPIILLLTKSDAVDVQGLKELLETMSCNGQRDKNAGDNTLNVIDFNQYLPKLTGNIEKTTKTTEVQTESNIPSDEVDVPINGFISDCNRQKCVCSMCFLTMKMLRTGPVKIRDVSSSTEPAKICDKAINIKVNSSNKFTSNTSIWQWQNINCNELGSSNASNSELYRALWQSKSILSERYNLPTPIPDTQYGVAKKRSYLSGVDMERFINSIRPPLDGAGVFGNKNCKCKQAIYMPL